jgi:hypothetical protein
MRLMLGFVLLFVIACDFKLYLIHLNVKEATKTLCVCRPHMLKPRSNRPLAQTPKSFRDPSLSRRLSRESGFQISREP